MVDTPVALGTGRKLRLGMVGGGRDAFIGAVHRIAARLEDRYDLVAGCLSSDPSRAAASAADLRLPADRSYADYEAMAREEAGRIDVVAIVTPNHLHVPVARAFLAQGIDVICDKPLSATLAEARALREAVASAGVIFALTYNNTGHAMVRHAREMVAAGALGDIRVVQAEYAQDWLALPIERDGHKQASWRLDPARSGVGGCISDIGTHAFNLAAYVTGQTPTEVCAELSRFVGGRALDDDASVMLRYGSGARGTLWASQVATGCENALSLRVYRIEGRVGVAAGAAERADRQRTRSRATPADQRRSGKRAGGTARDPDPGGSPGRLPRRIRHDLCRCGRADPGPPRGSRAEPTGHDRAGDRRRHGRDALRRRGREFIGCGRGLDRYVNATDRLVRMLSSAASTILRLFTASAQCCDRSVSLRIASSSQRCSRALISS